MQEIVTLATVPQERRIEIVNGRITFFFFWISAGDSPLIFINPSVTKWAKDLKDGVETESGGVTLTSEMRSIQFRDDDPVQTITLDDGERLRVTLQHKRKIGDYGMEIELFVESIDS